MGSPTPYNYDIYDEKERQLKEGDRVTWTRIYGAEKKLKSTECEFVRYVKGGKKVVIIQDGSVVERVVPIGKVVAFQR